MNDGLMDDTTTITEAAPPSTEDEEKPLIFLHGIGRHFRQGEATLDILKGAELAVWSGESVALIAPSGSGKSTLLHIAGLLEHPDSGEVYINAEPTSTLSDAARTRIRRTDIGFVYQFHHLLPEFSAVENVMLPQMVRGLSRKEAHVRAAELLSYLGLKDRLTHRPAELSGSGLRSRARLPTRRAFSSPTSRPAISTFTPPSTCSRRCASWCGHRASPRSSPRTISTSRRRWTVA